MTQMVCGVDVASESLEVRIGQQGAAGSFPNTPEGIMALGAFCQAHQVEMVAMEATGGYEQLAFAQLSEQGLAVAIVNPRAVRQFAQSMGSLEKTDRIDAAMIAWYAEVKKPQPACLTPPGQQQLRALVTRLRQLTDVRTAQRNQQRLVTDRAVQVSFAKLLAFVARQIRDLEQRIARLIEQDPLWRELNQAFRTIKGVADRTVARLMAEMPEIGLLSNKTVSKLAGLAPLANDSGKQQGKRAVRGGRAAVRDILYLVAGVAGRFEPDFTAFQQRLRAAGKPPKVVRIALAHKLLVRLNAKAREVRCRLALQTTSSRACA
ncbi:IS110 family RNA-guided transposase [Occallatibacter riparius]|uniref:IS110 family transposase n=1 Tax=Occallatibacter riparius TaxID=1002689 RepID=A0A9J7BU55_9BACT|nr:IS110 family transposase [Occallatibacter riparius]UWZ84517.1 IS110 family transposase [Occallatibacter riparius]UWZ85797.1 IS110 family transposase [Occallatibacter riparius]UWZ86095.1 IS110 family transposase [Occallatibacter riparius]UWZ86321.1 IS110 family transposase [Occallatibacter riparius]UWZ86508.1 IS110 family transposase [Occallatibacter riparius]